MGNERKQKIRAAAGGAGESDQAEAAPHAERLQKVLAAAGLGSRRKCEELITMGRVEVARQVVTELGTKVDPAAQEIRVDGQVLKVERPVYYLINKPAGVLSTNYDQAGRTRVVDLIEDNRRLFTVGRLDQSSEGLILVTNDGGLANRLAHPRYGVQKRYHVQVAGHPTEETLAALRRGVRLAEGYVQVDELSIRKTLPKSAVLEMVLGEGKNREIRRMLAKMGHKVMRLIRVALGPLKLADLPKGAYRQLEPAEIRALRAASDGKSVGKSAKAAKKRGKFVRRGSAPGAPAREPGASATGGFRPKTSQQRSRGGEEQKREQPRTPRPEYSGGRQGTVIGGDEGVVAPSKQPRGKRNFGKGRGGAGKAGKSWQDKNRGGKPKFGQRRGPGGKPA